MDLKYFNGSTVSDYLFNYLDAINDSIKKIDSKTLEAIFHLLKNTLQTDTHIYVGGNGGSASISDHLCCDWMKGTQLQSEQTLKIVSLMSNTALTSAIANDLGYENILSKQIELLCKPNDLLILISSSGNSKNIIEGAKKAKALKIPIIGLTGFNGGELKALADYSLHVPIHNYGVVEDCHQMLMHVFAQTLLLHKKDIKK